MKGGYIGRQGCGEKMVQRLKYLQAQEILQFSEAFDDLYYPPLRQTQSLTMLQVLMKKLWKILDSDDDARLLTMMDYGLLWHFVLNPYGDNIPIDIGKAIQIPMAILISMFSNVASGGTKLISD